MSRGRSRVPRSARPIGQAGLSGEFSWPEQAQRLVLIVHPDRASRLHAGHRFVVDVLRANGMATLSVGLRTPAEEACLAAVPTPDAVAARLRAMLAWLARHTELRPLQVGLLAVDAAVPACIAASGLPGLDAIRSMVLVDGRPELSLPAVRAWRWPTLALVGRNTLLPKTRGRRPARAGLPSPHRIVRLSEQTLPVAEPGAFEAIACEATAWLHAVVPPVLLAPPGRPGRSASSARMQKPQPQPLRAAAPRRRAAAEGVPLVLPLPTH